MACVITYNNKKYTQPEFNEYFKSHFFEFAGDFLGSKQDIENFANFIKNSNQEVINSPQFNLSLDTDTVTSLNTPLWFNTVITPILNRMSALFPQVRSKVISESDLSLLPQEVRNKIEKLNEKGLKPMSFFYNGEVYIVKERVTKDVAIEEFLHPFINALEIDNKELYKNLLLEAKKLFPELKDQIFKDYKDVYDSVFDLNREFLTQALSKMMGENIADAETTPQEVKSFIQKFISYLKELLNRLVNKKQMTNYNISEINENVTLSELTILLSKEGTIIRDISSGLNNTNEIQWALTKEVVDATLANCKNEIQRQAVLNISAKTNNLLKKKIETATEKGHEYWLFDEGGNLVRMTNVTSISSPGVYTGNTALGRFGTANHLIAEIINNDNMTQFSDEFISDLIDKVGLAEFAADSLVPEEYRDSTFKGKSPSKELAMEIAKNMANYILALKQRGSVLLSEVVLGDPETLIAGTPDIIEIKLDGTHVIHDFKSIGLFIPKIMLFKANTAYDELTVEGAEVLRDTWNQAKRQVSMTKQQSLYKAILSKIVETNPENITLQIVPIFYQKETPFLTEEEKLEKQERGEEVNEKDRSKDKMYVGYYYERNQIYFPIQVNVNEYSNTIAIDEDTALPYRLKYDKQFVSKEGITVPKILSQDEEKRNRDLEELQKIQLSDKFNPLVNDLFVQVNKIVAQYGSSKDKVKQEIYQLFTKGDESAGDIASIKTAIEILYKDIEAGVPVEQTAVKFAQLLNYMNETFIGINNIKANFIAQSAKGIDLNNSNEIYDKVNDLRVIYLFAKSFDPIISTIAAELDDTANDNVFKQMVSKAKADISKIEQLYQDNIIPLLARGLELQISPEVREAVSKEVNARIEIETKQLTALMSSNPDDPKIPIIKDKIDKLKKELELMIPDQTIFSKMIKGDYGDASLLWSNLIANINNPDMIIASATKMLSDILIDLNTDSMRTVNAYGDQLEKIVEVKGDKRKNIKELYKDLLYSVKKIRMKQDGSVEEWKQKHIITDIDENVYYEYDKLKIALEIARKENDSKTEEGLKVIEKAKKAKADFEKLHFEPKYTEEVEKALNSLNTNFTATIDGKLVSKNPKEIIDGIFKQIRTVSAPYTREEMLQQLPSVPQDVKDQLDLLWMEYNNLASDYDLNGNEKNSLDKKIAEAVRKKKETLDKLRTKVINENLWKTYRDKMITLYGEDSSEFKEWEANNTIIEVDPDVYKDRDKIKKDIKDIIDKYKNNSQIALLEEESQALWEKIFELTKPYRKKGIIESELIPDSVKEKIKDAEEKAGNIQKQIKSLMEGVSKEDKDKLKDLYKELENLFVTQETPQYYIDLQLAQATVKSEEGIEVATLDDDYMYAHSQWFRDNHIRTEVETQTGETYFKYKAVYYYRINKATDSTKNKLVPGKQYWSFTLPENPNYTDMFGRRTLKKTSSFYRPENYRKLESSTTKEGKVNFDTIKFLRERTENAQRDLHQVNQIGYAVPTLRKSVWDRIMDGTLKGSFKNFKAAVFKTAQDRDEGIYDNDSTVITDLSGEETKFIPVKYTTKIEEEEQSYDVFKGFFMYEMSAKKSTMLEKNKGYFEALEEQLTLNTPKKSGVVEAITKGLANRFKDFDIQIERPKGSNNERADSIIDLINRVFYDEYKKDWFKTKIFGQTISDTKIGDGILGFAGSRMMFGNVWNWATNMISGNIQSLLESTSGRYITPKDLAWAKSKIPSVGVDTLKDRAKFNNVSYFTQMARYFNYAQGEYENELGEKLSWTEWTQGTHELFYSGKIFGEWEMQTANFLAMMNAKKVFQIQPNGNKNMITFWDAFESGADGVPVLKQGVVDANDNPITEQNIKDYMRRIQGLNKMLNGAYSQFDQLKTEKYSLVRALTFMRKYFVPMFVNRFGKLRTDLELGDVREGYYATTGQLLREWFTLGRSIMSRWKDGDLTDLQRQNLKKMGAELLFLATFSVIIAILSALGADDDDEEALKMMRYLTNKVRREFVSTVPIPGLGLQEFYSVFSSPVIAIGQIGQGAKLMSQLAVLPLNVASGGEWYEDELYYQRASGMWEKGDSKVLATMLKLGGVKTNIFDADELEKAYENQIRWK